MHARCTPLEKGSVHDGAAVTSGRAGPLPAFTVGPSPLASSLKIWDPTEQLFVGQTAYMV